MHVYSRGQGHTVALFGKGYYDVERASSAAAGAHHRNSRVQALVQGSVQRFPVRECHPRRVRGLHGHLGSYPEGQGAPTLPIRLSGEAEQGVSAAKPLTVPGHREAAEQAFRAAHVQGFECHDGGFGGFHRPLLRQDDGIRRTHCAHLRGRRSCRGRKVASAQQGARDIRGYPCDRRHRAQLPVHSHRRQGLQETHVDVRAKNEKASMRRG